MVHPENKIRTRKQSGMMEGQHVFQLKVAACKSEGLGCWRRWSVVTNGCFTPTLIKSLSLAAEEPRQCWPTARKILAPGILVGMLGQIHCRPSTVRRIRRCRQFHPSSQAMSVEHEFPATMHNLERTRESQPCFESSTVSYCS